MTMGTIGVASQAQHGKDTLANYLCDKLNHKEGFAYWKRVGFADEVKRVYCETFGVKREFVEEWKVKPENPPGFDLPVRKSLQFIGDGFRQIKSTIWLDLAFRNKVAKIISDVRYPNEWQRVKAEGGINILIGRPDKLNDDPNGSEALVRPLVVWCLKNLGRAKVFDFTSNDIARNYEGNHILDAITEELWGNFHLFVRNDGSIEDFYHQIDEHVIPFVERFQFSQDE